MDPGETEKSLSLTQIRYLEEQLERCESKYDELEKQNNQLTRLCSTLEKDKKDSTEYLKHFVVAAEKKIDELDKQLELLHKAAAKERKALMMKHIQEMEERQEKVDKLMAENTKLVAILEKQNEQLVKLEEIKSNMESMRKHLMSTKKPQIHQKEEHEAALSNLRKDAEIKKKKISEMLQASAESHVQQETSQILKNERCLFRLFTQDLPTVKRTMQRESKGLRDSEGAASAEKAEMEKHVQEINGRGRFLRKKVNQLKDIYLQLEDDMNNKVFETGLLLADEENLRNKLHAVHRESCHEAAELVQLEAEVQRQKKRRRQLEQVKQEATIILRHMMKSRGQSQDKEKKCSSRWEMERLLDILESAAPQGTDSSQPQTPNQRGKSARL